MAETNDQEIQYIIRPIGERVSILESQHEAIEGKLNDIMEKLDGLLQLKYKGMGAISFVSILIASATGILGVIAAVMGFFNGSK